MYKDEMKTIEDIKGLIKEDRRNVLHRYCRKIEYYEAMGYSRKKAIYKAKEFYGMIRKNATKED